MISNFVLVFWSKSSWYFYKQIPVDVEVPRDMKEPRDDTSESDISSSAKTDVVTSNFECNVSLEDQDVILPAETTMSGSDLDGDLKCHSTSNDEREMPNVPPWLREAVK